MSDLCIQSITIPIGGSMTIPAGATLLGVDSTTTPVLTATCDSIDDQLDDLPQFLCYKFGYGTDNDANTGHTLDETNTTIAKATVGGVDYTLNLLVANSGTSGFSDTITATIPTHLMKFVSVETNTLSKRIDYVLHVKMLASIAAETELFITGQGFDPGAYIRPVVEDCA